MNYTVNPNEAYNPKLNIGKSDIYGWQYTSSGQVNGISGNVDLNMIYKSTSNVVTPNPSFVVETSITQMGKVNTKSDNLNIRISPDSDSTKVGFYKKGAVIQLIAKTSNGWYKTDNGSWYKCKLNNGAIGWVSKKYIMTL